MSVWSVTAVLFYGAVYGISHYYCLCFQFKLTLPKCFGTTAHKVLKGSSLAQGTQWYFNIVHTEDVYLMQKGSSSPHL